MKIGLLTYGGIISYFLLSPLNGWAQTWDGAVAGKITQIHTASGFNADFRVYLDGKLLCGPNSNYWAYMNHDYDNYQATASLLTTAWVSGRVVTLYTTKDANGWCKIGYVAAQ